MRSRIVRGRGFEHVLNPGTYVIGRDESCRIRLESGKVSRRHAVLVVSAESLVIEDLGGSQGVVVNGKRLVRPQPLSIGDVVGLADETLTFVERSSGGPTQPLAIGSLAAGGSIVPPHDEEATEVEPPPSGPGDASAWARAVDGALHAGNFENAEALISTRWIALATNRGTNAADSEDLSETAGGALRLALAKRDSAWVGRVLIAYLDRKLLMPVAVVDALAACFTASPNVYHELLVRYRDLIESERLREDPKNAYAILRYFMIVRRVIKNR